MTAENQIGAQNVAGWKESQYRAKYHEPESRQGVEPIAVLAGQYSTNKPLRARFRAFLQMTLTRMLDSLKALS